VQVQLDAFNSFESLEGLPQIINGMVSLLSLNINYYCTGFTFYLADPLILYKHELTTGQVVIIFKESPFLVRQADFAGMLLQL